MDIKFHCDSEKLFKNEKQQIRAFLYSEYSIEPHTHDFYEINIVLKGSGTHQIKDACFNTKTGDIFIIPPMTVHAYYNTNNLDVYHILVHKKFILENQAESVTIPGFVQLMEIEPFLRQHFSSAMFLHLSPNQFLQLKSDLSFIDDDNFNNEEFMPLKKHTMWKILYWLSDLLFKQIQTVKKNSLNKYESYIIQALEYIHLNYSDKITIEMLCKKTFLSRSTFLRSFYSVCACTPIQYLNRYRCEKAIEMIKTGNFSKTDIAHLCGFYDLSHMERILKNFTP